VKTDVFGVTRMLTHPRHASPSADDLRQVTRGFTMKRFTSIVIGAGLLAATSLANANSSGQLAQVTVHQDRPATDCTPPNDNKECADLHAAIRKNFSRHEIGMLFGAATGYQEYKTSYDRVRAKYAAFARDVEERGLAVAVAAK
jgi:hypothetical protein